MSEDLRQWAGPIAPPGPAELADRYALGQLARVYALGVDMRDYELARSVFAADAIAEGSFSGPIDDYLPKVHGGAAAYQATQHNITNQYVSLNGDEALVWSYAVAVHKVAPGESRDDGRKDMTLGVQYRDACRRFPEGWLIVRRQAVIQWSEFPEPRSASR